MVVVVDAVVVLERLFAKRLLDLTPVPMAVPRESVTINQILDDNDFSVDTARVCATTADGFRERFRCVYRTLWGRTEPLLLRY